MLIAKWIVEGNLLERRTLTSPKNPEWRGYIAKVASHGHTFEIHVSAEHYELLASAGESEVLHFEGRFEGQGHGVKLVGLTIAKPRSSAA